MAHRTKCLSIYRNLLRSGRSFPDYNTREFIIRRTKEDFRQGKDLVGPSATAALKEAHEQLGVVQRQSAIAGFYQGEPSVMETLEGKGGKASSRALTALAGEAALGVPRGTVIDDV